MSIQGPGRPAFPDFPNDAPWVNIGEIKIGEHTYRIEVLPLKLDIAEAGSVYRAAENVARKISNHEEVKRIIQCLGQCHLQNPPDPRHPDTVPTYREVNQVVFHAGYAKIDNEDPSALAERLHREIKEQSAVLIPYHADFHRDRLEKISNELALYEAALSRIFGGRRVVLQQIPHTQAITEDREEAIRSRHPVGEIDAILTKINTNPPTALTEAEKALCTEIMGLDSTTPEPSIDEKKGALERFKNSYPLPAAAAPAPPPAVQPGFFRKMWNKIKGIF